MFCVSNSSTGSSYQRLMRDRFFMRIAIDFAKHAALMNEVPIGAVVVANDIVLAGSFNQPINTHDPCAHAELLALRSAAKKLKNYRLINCEIFTTLEPCVMCAGAIMYSRIRRLVFGASNPKGGASGGVLNLFGMANLNHHTLVTEGVEGEICQSLLKNFFRAKRKNHNHNIIF